MSANVLIAGEWRFHMKHAIARHTAPCHMCPRHYEIMRHMLRVTFAEPVDLFKCCQCNDNRGCKYNDVDGSET